MLKTQVTMGNISRALLNLIKRLIFVIFKYPSAPIYSRSENSYFLFSSPITTFALLPYLFGYYFDTYFHFERVYLRGILTMSHLIYNL